MAIESGIPSHTRQRLVISGIVQGVGFRPFVYHLAHQLGLSGWVSNTPGGVVIEIQGPPPTLDRFQTLLISQVPGPIHIQDMAIVMIPNQLDNTFVIRASYSEGPRYAVIPPDLATCADCLAEINDPSSRRFRYPFTTCTQCGPRFSIVEDIPFDRDHTTMKQFPMCRDCQHEYEDITDRRFHAEAIACPNCGPRIMLWDHTGHVVTREEWAVTQACEILRNGNILAMKGLGGFQLWVNGGSEEAVRRLRQRKHRPRKPFAVLFPSLDSLQEQCLVSPEEARLLTSPEAPIVLLRRMNPSSLAPAVAPDNPYVGAMLPYTPLHHLLMDALQTPVVATSGNRTDEPIVIDEQDALIRLHGIADAFLVHDRPIARPVDDSVARIVNGDLMMLRRARGYTPTPIFRNVQRKNKKVSPSILTVGGHLKNTIGVTTQDQVIVSQHIGDLSTPEAYTQFQHTIADQLKLFDVSPNAIICDLHPDYRSTIFAKILGQKMNIPVIPIQHHYAHILSCMAEHGLEGPVLGIAWDGAGYGTDGTIWGGEFLLADHSGFQRLGHLRPFRLPGGEICMREPRRVALSLLYEAFGEACVEMDLPPVSSLGRERANSLVELLKKDVNSPITTSMGRLFDGISSLLGLCHINTFEGEAAMALEFLIRPLPNHDKHEDYSWHFLFPAQEGRGVCARQPVEAFPFLADWTPLIQSIVQDIENRTFPETIAWKFHHSLIPLIMKSVSVVPCDKIVLSGGVFQNTVLLNQLPLNFPAGHPRIYTHRYFSPNDAGLSLGQAIGPTGKNLDG